MSADEKTRKAAYKWVAELITAARFDIPDEICGEVGRIAGEMEAAGQVPPLFEIPAAPPLTLEEAVVEGLVRLGREGEKLPAPKVEMDDIRSGK